MTGPWTATAAQQVRPRSPYRLGALGGWAAGMLGGAGVLYGVSGVLGLAGVTGAGLIQALASMGALAATVLFLVWLHHARSNIELLDPRCWSGRRRLGGGWAIGAWFIPVGFLWLPLLVVLDVWWGSSSPVPRRRTPKLVAAWWTCWLLAWFTSFRVVHGAQTPQGSGSSVSVQAYLGSTVASGLFSLAAGVLCALVVRRITSMQQGRFGF